MMALLNCVVCKQEFKRHGKQAAQARTCSKKCLSVFTKSKTDHTPNTICAGCGKEFWLKLSQKVKYRRLGHHCSMACLAETKRKAYYGANNPNFRSRSYDDDGYVLRHYTTQGREKLHRAVVKEVLGRQIPKGLVVHHRDCERDNNTAENLAVLSESDHRWLHKQYGNATLWAYRHGKIDLESLVSWSNDTARARRLLPLNVTTQIGYIGDGMKIRLVLKHPLAVRPFKSHPSDACWDLTAASVDDSDPRYIEYDTGVIVEVPANHALMVFPRSSISKYDLTLANGVGVVDPGYLGTVRLRFRRHGNRVYEVGDRIGQMLIIEHPAFPDFEMVEADELSETPRGEGGFGSSGI